MNITNANEEINQLLTKSGDAKLCEQAFKLSQTKAKEHGIIMNDVQQKSLLSHLSAMVHRSLTGERLPVIDQSIFACVSSESILTAKAVKDSLDNLDEDEIYLLSIHFEAAKQNS
jgi:PRD domain protein (TIGR03582 family)